jgi:hypothetical protein
MDRFPPYQCPQLPEVPKMPKKDPFQFKAAPGITISSTCSWDEMSMTWTPKKLNEYSAALSLWVRLAKGTATDDENSKTTLAVKTDGGTVYKAPTENDLKPYKSLPLPPRASNKKIALFFGKGGTPTMSQLQRAISGTEYLQEAVRRLYWLSASQIKGLIKKYNEEMSEDFGVPAMFLMKLRPMKKPPKKTDWADIAWYLIQKAGKAGATRDWSKVEGIGAELLEELKKAQDQIKKRKSKSD